MAPPVYHRIRWDEGGKEDVVLIGHRLFLAGTAALALGMFGAVFVVADFLFGLVSAIVAVVILLALITVTWYVLPLERGRDPTAAPAATSSPSTRPTRSHGTAKCYTAKRHNRRGRPRGRAPPLPSMHERQLSSSRCIR